MSNECMHDTTTLADIDRCQTVDGSIIIMPFKLCADCKQAIPLSPEKFKRLTPGTVAEIQEYFSEKRGCEVQFP